MTRSKFFSVLLVSVISILLVVAGCASAAAPVTTPPAKPAPATPTATIPAATTPATPAATTPAATAPAAKELSFKAATYTNDAEGFSVKYPADWAKSMDDYQGLVYAARAATQVPMLLVYVYATTDQDELVKLSDAGFKSNTGSNIKRAPFENIKLGASTGLYTVTNWDYMGSYNLDTYSFSVVHNGKFVVVATTMMSGNPKDKTLSQEIFGTITFK